MQITDSRRDTEILKFYYYYEILTAAAASIFVFPMKAHMRLCPAKDKTTERVDAQSGGADAHGRSSRRQPIHRAFRTGLAPPDVILLCSHLRVPGGPVWDKSIASLCSIRLGANQVMAQCRHSVQATLGV